MREARENDMRLKAFASVVMFVLFAFGFGAPAQQSERVFLLVSVPDDTRTSIISIFSVRGFGKPG
jgi:hypothetical protein